MVQNNEFVITRVFDVTDEECKTLESGKESMEQGFGGTFDQLDEYVVSLTLQQFMLNNRSWSVPNKN